MALEEEIEDELENEEDREAAALLRTVEVEEEDEKPIKSNKKEQSINLNKDSVFEQG